MVQSQLERGLHVLELLAPGPLRGTDVANALGVHRSTAMRMLNELSALGYVSREDGDHRYQLELQRFAWVVPALEASDFVSAFRPLLQRLHTVSDEAIVLSLPIGGMMVYLDYLPARSAIGVQERVGAHRPVHASAVGQAWLSGLDDGERERVIAGLALVGGTDRAVRTRDELARRVAETRERGWALDLGETIDGANCVAVPVWFRGRLLGAVAISAPAERLDEERLDYFGRVMVEATTGGSSERVPGQR